MSSELDQTSSRDSSKGSSISFDVRLTDCEGGVNEQLDKGADTKLGPAQRGEELDFEAKRKIASQYIHSDTLILKRILTSDQYRNNLCL